MPLVTLTRSFGLVCLLSLLTMVVKADESLDAIFENHVRPTLIDSCFSCHGGGKISGGLRVDSLAALLEGGDSGAALVPESPSTSLLIKAIRRHEEVSAMPPDEEKSLSPEQIAAIETWIRLGAQWPENVKKFESKTHWAFEPIETATPPQSDDPAASSIDAFIRAKQRSSGVPHAARTDKVTLIRRATFDLTGLPPTPGEVAAFEQDDSLNAFRTVVDRLLQSPEYGKRWGRHWLDVVRYADTAGETADYPVPLAWRYRNYVIDAFNSDKPYDQFLQEQIAGDVIASHSSSDRYAEQVTATGYLAISRRFGFDSENYHHLTIQDTIDNLGLTVLGLSLGCARCHDHKFDAISTSDYYGLYGIFDSSRYAFPGSEQKQKVRSLAPLLPPTEAISKWSLFDQRVGELATSLEKRQQPVSAALLRSLNDIDGDFEMQAAAAGGSNGVLVPPWLYVGKIAITNSAQSPYKNLYASGKVGASIGEDSGDYRIYQALYPHQVKDDSPDAYFNLDFRIHENSGNAGSHRFSVDDSNGTPAFVLLLQSDSASIQVGQDTHKIGPVTGNEWHTVQIHLDRSSRTVSGALSTNTAMQTFGRVAVNSDWSGSLGGVVIENTKGESSDSPGIDFDNLAIRSQAIATPTIELSIAASQPSFVDETQLTQQLNELIGISGDFEFQTDGAAPDKPWNAGPNSVVNVSSLAQSTFANLFQPGTLGVRMPNRAQYDGFGLSLPKIWSAPATEQLFANFDFKIADVSTGGDGSWRFYIGHGPGNSAAVELCFNGKQLFRRSGDARDAVCSLTVGVWNQVNLALDLTSKTYTGTIVFGNSQESFHGDFATGWDGSVDYSFIDSYGHLGGIRPAVDLDNYDIRDVEAVATSENVDFAERRQQAMLLRQQIESLKTRNSADMQELSTLLAEGPFDLAYGMSEGTPHDVPVQIRGEPSQLGEIVPRGFATAIGGATLPRNTSGSGRLELSQWLTSLENPLTARVMVNRIWQYHFGRGLVKTPNDFGVRGIPPTHPELLDFLAMHFIQNGWSIKTMHRLIMLSETYQQSSAATPIDDHSVQKSNHGESDTRDLYTQFERRRLSAEEIRDSILVVSGELDHEPGREHPFPSPISWGYSQHGPFTAVYDHNKRSVYLMTQRLKRHPYLALFDGADPNATTADRLGTTVPTQALFFMNDPFIYTKSDAWAKRLQASHLTPQECVESAYVNAFAREATADEMSAALDFLATYDSELATTAEHSVNVASLAALLRTLFASNEFVYLD